MDKKIELILNAKYEEYNNRFFIDSDPVSIPHMVSNKEDIEIIGFLVATIAWGGRKAIIKSGKQMLKLMDNAPHDFILNFKQKDLSRFENFVYRTFNSDDMIFFQNSLQNIYKNHGSIEDCFAKDYSKNKSIKEGIEGFRNIFLETEHLKRSEKHISSPSKNSASKRINMYLRWMIRKDNNGVDFGIWDKISQSDLICPLDVHSSRVSRKLGLLKRKQTDWKAAEELTQKLRKIDKNDPVKYDFALFGLGVFEQFGI